jgi:hypothetical protein
MQLWLHLICKDAERIPADLNLVAAAATSVRGLDTAEEGASHQIVENDALKVVSICGLTRPT